MLENCNFLAELNKQQFGQIWRIITLTSLTMSLFYKGVIEWFYYFQLWLILVSQASNEDGDDLSEVTDKEELVGGDSTLHSSMQWFGSKHNRWSIIMVGFCFAFGFAHSTLWKILKKVPLCWVLNQQPLQLKIGQCVSPTSLSVGKVDLVIDFS